MSDLKDRLAEDLKRAMLSGDKRLVSVLKGVKTALQYAEVAGGAGFKLSEEECIKVLQKESKKRTDAITLYQNVNDTDRVANEKYEKDIIDNYLPEMMSKDEVSKLVEEVIQQLDDSSPQSMGKAIGLVKEKSGGRAEGSLIAQLVKERLA
ncbi:MAG TPA: GatB/YqeY domain-containing protein [Patescibacteria group bacterium]|nr:GatB/YqeY domain-containing protein [Patescibacteria group bacterium]